MGIILKILDEIFFISLIYAMTNDIVLAVAIHLFFVGLRPTFADFMDKYKIILESESENDNTKVHNKYKIYRYIIKNGKLKKRK